jgi:hypothetical protein
VHCGDQSNFVAADIKHSEFPDLVCVGKGLAQLHEIRKAAFPHNRVPMREGRFGGRVFSSELIQALPRNDVHYELERLIGTFPDEKGERGRGVARLFQGVARRERSDLCFKISGQKRLRLGYLAR